MKVPDTEYGSFGYEIWKFWIIKSQALRYDIMNVEDVRTYCLTLPGATEDMPYGPDCVVFRIEGKIFLHMFLDRGTMAIKLLPEHGEELRDKYSAVTPAWHLNKRHWNDVVVACAISSATVEEWIKESYNLVLSKLPKALKEKYKNS